MKPISTNEFIKKAIKVHGNEYDYSHVKYINNTTPVDIICSIHGIFKQKPINHAHRKCGCPLCYRDSRKFDKKEFIKRAISKYGDKFKYGEYNGYKKPIEIVCKKHGKFVSSPILHLRPDGNGGCSHCRIEKISISDEEWIKRFRKVYKNKYDYSNTKNIKSQEKIEVICPIHGIFYPFANNHAKGVSGCPTCACSKYVGGYSESYFKKHPEMKSKTGIFYLIKIWNDNEIFYKVGVTIRSIDERFKYKLPSVYEYEILIETKMSLYNAYLMEHKYLKEHTSVSYIPKLRFSGWTECFKQVII
jgi:hypothetical protein